MKIYSPLTVTTGLLVISLLLAITCTHGAPSDRWDDDDLDQSLVQLVTKRLMNQMTDFERMRRTGLSARQVALSNYLKAKELSANIHNPFGPGRRK